MRTASRCRTTRVPGCGCWCRPGWGSRRSSGSATSRCPHSRSSRPGTPPSTGCRPAHPGGGSAPLPGRPRERLRTGARGHVSRRGRSTCCMDGRGRARGAVARVDVSTTRRTGGPPGCTTAPRRHWTRWSLDCGPNTRRHHLLAAPPTRPAVRQPDVAVPNTTGLPVRRGRPASGERGCSGRRCCCAVVAGRAHAADRMSTRPAPPMGRCRTAQ